jgi:hypothetical protein
MPYSLDDKVPSLYTVTAHHALYHASCRTHHSVQYVIF